MRQERILRLADQVILFTNCVCNVFVTLGWGVLLWPASRIHRKLHYRIVSRMCTWLANQLVFWILASGHQCFEVGEDVSACYGQNCLVISNHQSSFDPCILMMTFCLKGLFERTMWILDNWIRYTPFGTCAWLRGDFFVNQGQGKKDLEQTRLKHHLLNKRTGSHWQWVVFFPEGGFLSKRRERSQRYSKEHGLPILQHVCLPRTGAFETIITTLHPKNKTGLKTPLLSRENVMTERDSTTMKWIIDITIGYQPNNALPRFETLGMFRRKPSKIVLHYRMFPIEEIPNDHEEQKYWLYQRYEEKEDLLRVFHETGAFPERLHTRNSLLKSPVPIKGGTWMQLFAFTFLIVSIVFQYWVLKRLVTLWPVHVNALN